MSESFDRTLLKNQMDASLEALEEYAKRIGRAQNPTPVAAREWSARLLFFIGEHRLFVDQLTKAIHELNVTKSLLNRRLNEMARANMEKD